jgi:hypothetical protein
LPPCWLQRPRSNCERKRRSYVAARLGTYVVFPLELAGLAAMLWQMRSGWAVAMLIGYTLFAALRTYRFALNAVIVKPKPRFLIVLHEYYDLFLPLAILIESRDWLVLVIHVILFPNRLRHTIGDAAQLWRERRRPRHEAV